MIPPQIPILRSRWLPAVLVAATTLLGFGIGIISLMAGWNTIFQNLLYFPIILACVFYTRRGFVLSVAIACGYFVLMALFSHDAVVLEGAFIRVLIFILVAGVITYLSEIRNRTEAALQESNDLFQRLIHGSFDAVIIYQDGRLVLVNDAALRMMGEQEPDALLGRPVIDFVHPDYREDVGKRMQEMLASKDGAVPIMEEKFLRLDGSSITVAVMATATQHEGKPAVMVVFRDITDQKKAEEEVFQSRQMLQAVLDAIPQRVFWKDRQSVFLGCNRPLALDAGYTEPADLVGKTDYDYTTAEIAEMYRADDRQVMESGVAKINYEEPQVRPDGDRAWLSTSKIPLRERSGEIIGVLGTYEDITERKKMEEALRESEERYRALSESTTDIIFIHDKDGTFRYMNQTGAKILGISTDNIIGKNLADIFPEAIASKQQQAITKTFTTTQTVIEEMQIPIKGELRWFEPKLIPLMAKDGTVTGVMGSVRDITERKRMDEALRESEKRYRDMFEINNAVMLILDPETAMIVDANAAASRFYGYSREELRSMSISAINTMDRSEVNKALSRAAENKGAVFQFRHRKKNGEVRDVEAFSAPLVVENRVLLHSIIQDITERKQAEEHDRNAKEEWERTFNAVPDLMCTLDLQHKIHRINTSMAKKLGVTPQEAEGKTCYEVVHGTQSPPDFCPHSQLIRDQQEHTVEVHQDRLGGDYLVTCTPLRDREGHLIGSVHVARDITERKLAEEALRESEEKYRVLFIQMTEGCALHEMIYDGSGNAMDYRILDVNPAFEFILGLKREEVVGKTGRGAYGVDLPPFLDTYARVVSTGRPESFEVYFAPMETHFFISTYSPGPGRFATIFSDITERKRAEDALKSSEELLRLFIEHAPAALAMLDGDLRYIAVSRRWRADYHVGDRDIIGHSHLEIFPELPDEIIAVLHRGLAGEVSSSNEDKFVRQDGAVQWLAWEVRPWYTSGQNIGGVIIFSEDITERKLAEEALQQSEEKYRTIVEDNQDMVYRADMNGIFTMINPAGARLVGLKSPSELIGRPVAKWYMNPDDRTEFIEALKKSGSVENFPVALKAADGAIRHVLASSHFFYDPEGNVQGVEGIIHDVTELRHTEEALHIAQEKFSKAFQEAPDGITISDLDSGEFLEVNDAATKILGYSRNELIGHTAIDLGIWTSREKREEFISQLRKEGRVEQYEVVERRKSGEIFYCHINADTITIGNRKCFLAVIRDVTEEKNAQDALKKAHDELEVRVQERTAALRESEERLRLKLDSVLSPDTDIGKLELANILDIPEIQSLMEDFTHLTGMTTAILDMKGNIIEATGWQDICTKFHRKNEKTAKFCTESDLFLAENLAPGQHIMYKCKNGLWDVATPLYFGTKHAGNIYTGQFFFTDEPVDKNAFLARAEEYGFDKNEYMAAVSRVPRFSREQVDILMDYLVRFTLLISRISFSNLELAQAKNRLELTAEDLRKLTDDLDRRVVERTAELSSAQEAYRRANKKLNLLSSITRHDIKNQLLALSGFLEISKESLSNPATLANFIAKEERIAETIAHQINFTKDYEDLGVKAPVWQNVDEVIRRAVARLPLGKVRVIPGDTALEIFADPLLEKVFYNLTDNALRYGGEEITSIQVSQRINNGDLILIFEDDGEGIQYGEKARLFTKGFGKHTGLGLYLSREILSITDITITENGEPGKGARFEITIPHGMYRGMNEEK